MSLSKLGPDVSPIGGTEIATSYLALGDAFNRNALVNCDRPPAGQPLVNQSLADTEANSEGRLGDLSRREVV